MMMGVSERVALEALHTTHFTVIKSDKESEFFELFSVLPFQVNFCFISQKNVEI
jgi:hypothetical protein